MQQLANKTWKTARVRGLIKSCRQHLQPISKVTGSFHKAQHDTKEQLFAKCTRTKQYACCSSVMFRQSNFLTKACCHQAYLRLSFGVLQDGHGVRVGNCVTQNSWSKHSSQVTDVHTSVQTVSNSERFYENL